MNSGLEMLLLADNPFGDEGGKQLAAVLCNNNRSLRVLDIHGTRMSSQGEKEVRGTVTEGTSFHACLTLLLAWRA